MPPTKKKTSKKYHSTSTHRRTARIKPKLSGISQRPLLATESNNPTTKPSKPGKPNTTKQSNQSSNPGQEQILVGFPNHLFKLENWSLPDQSDKSAVRGIHYILYEHPIFFGHRQTPGNLNYNKSRLIYVRAAILSYLDYLNQHLGQQITTSNGNIIKLLSATFVSVDDCLANQSALASQIKKLIVGGKLSTATLININYWDPVDVELSHTVLERQMKHPTSKTPVSIRKLDSPLFLTTEPELAEYHSKHSTGRFTHSAFYDWQKTRPNMKEFKFPGHSYDTENRGQMPLTTQIPELPKLQTADTKYLQLAEKYISAHRLWSSKSRPGSSNTLNNIVFPISHDATWEWFQNFLAKKLGHFGKYQDSIDGQARNYLFHSCISPMQNLGLITPNEVVAATHKYYQSHGTTIGVANYEGFIRQVIGWREYQRYIYLYAGDKMRRSNHFGNHGKLTTAWYSGTLGIRPVDDAIKMAFRDGYLHHILRLMVMGNFMNLAGLHPDEVYRWFMEFALDSYDWVMVGNVYSMALWADGGLSMRKPYISSDTYIMSLGTYEKESGQTTNHLSNSSSTSQESTASGSNGNNSSSDSTESSESSDNSTKAEPTNKQHLGWNRAWYILFYHFINRCQTQLKSTYYAGLVKAWNNKQPAEKEQILSDAKSVIKYITK
jgi:deoxyribodipyrimidine photolyase-related protein